MKSQSLKNPPSFLPTHIGFMALVQNSGVSFGARPQTLIDRTPIERLGRYDSIELHLSLLGLPTLLSISSNDSKRFVELTHYGETTI